MKSHKAHDQVLTVPILDQDEDNIMNGNWKIVFFKEIN